MNARERTFVGALDATEAAMDKSGADFRAMDGATSGLVASATTTGARLASAHRVTESARTTLGMLQARSAAAFMFFLSISFLPLIPLCV